MAGSKNRTEVRYKYTCIIIIIPFASSRVGLCVREKRTEGSKCTTFFALITASPISVHACYYNPI